MSERDWNKFFELVDKIVSGCSNGSTGTWKETASLVKSEAESRDSLTNFEELISWFDEEVN